MKRVPLKVMIMVLITGIVSVAGNFFLKYNLTQVINNYNTIVEEYTDKRECMTEISGLLYHHQNLICNCLLAYSDSIRTKYKMESEKQEAELGELIKEFGKNMEGGEKEQLYHQLFSKYNTYKEQVDNLFFYVSENDLDTAIYYNNGDLASCITKINDIISKLDELTMQDIATTQDKIQDAVHLSTLSTATFSLVVVILTIFCVIFCVRITGSLDRYKQQLETKLIQKNAQLQIHNQKTMALQDSIILGIANLIEDRDGDTGQHVRRTSAYVKMLAKAAKNHGLYADVLTDKYIDRLVKAAPLHDIGKIMISDTILLKPGKLTDEEFEIMKTHAAQGGRIVRETFTNLEDREYVKMADDVATHHHEKWNGAGYPDHLSGNDIPLSARIMAIADVFDALVSKRCYKDPMSYEKAFDIIKESSGSHFDPSLVDIFLGMKSEILQFLSHENSEDPEENQDTQATIYQMDDTADEQDSSQESQQDFIQELDKELDQELDQESDQDFNLEKNRLKRKKWMTH